MGRGETIDSSFGMRQMQTFRNEPTTAPKIKTKTGYMRVKSSVDTFGYIHGNLRLEIHFDLRGRLKTESILRLFLRHAPVNSV